MSELQASEPMNTALTRERVEGVERIAVLRAGGIGDLVFALPALHALAAAYPQATITLLGSPPHAEVLAGRPGPVDRTVVVPPTAGVRLGVGEREDGEEQAAFFAAMQAECFDLAVQLHGGGRRSNPFVRRLGARVAAGMHDAGVAPLDRSAAYVYWQREVLRNLEVAALVGAPPVGVVPSLPVLPAERRAAQAALGLTHDGARQAAPIVVLHPGAGAGRRRWPPAGFAAVGDELAADGARVVVVGGPGDESIVAEIVHGMRCPAAVDVHLSLAGLLGLFASVDVVIANDSGPLHLARAVGAATVAVYWCGNVVNAGPMETDRHRVALSWRLACPACGADCMADGCGHDESFVADVPATEVLSAARSLLAFAG